MRDARLLRVTHVEVIAMQSTVKGVLHAALLLWILFGVFAWSLRDGLGPESVESRGWDALHRAFWTFYWGPVAIVLVLATLALRRRSRPS